MIHPTPDATWPESWKLSYSYDLMEVFGCSGDRGYAAIYRDRQRRTLRLVEKWVDRGASILDIAAAQGNFSLILAEQGYHVTWNDLRKELAEYVKLKWDAGHLAFAPGNICELTGVGKFDAVLMTEVIEHVAHPDEFLKQCAALVKPGGYLILTSPNGGYFRNELPRFSECLDPGQYEHRQFQPDADGHIFLLDPDEVADLARTSGLQLVECDVFSVFTCRWFCRVPLVNKWFEDLCGLLPQRTKSKVMTQMFAVFKKSRDQLL